MKESMTDQQFAQLYQQVEKLEEELRVVEKPYYAKLNEWGKAHDQLTVEKERRRIRAEVMKELGQ